MVLVLSASAPAGNPAEHWTEHPYNVHEQPYNAEGRSYGETAVADLLKAKTEDYRAGNDATEHDDEGGPKWTDVIMAVFTIILAVSTGLLWWETYRLRRVAVDQQILDENARKADAIRLDKSLMVAERSANAAFDQATVAEAAYKASNRPWLIIEPVMQGRRTERFSFIYRIVNYGNSPAFLHERFELLLCPKRMPTIDDIDALTAQRVSGLMIRAGDASEPIFAEIGSGAERAEKNARIFVVGLIKYESVNNLPCQTRFCWEYDSHDEKYYEVQHPYGLNQRT